MIKVDCLPPTLTGCATLYRKGVGCAPLKPLLHMAPHVPLVVY
jgi:hypothetical protein